LTSLITQLDSITLLEIEKILDQTEKIDKAFSLLPHVKDLVK